MYTKIKVNISYFNQDAKQNSATCKNAEKNTEYLVDY